MTLDPEIEERLKMNSYGKIAELSAEVQRIKAGCKLNDGRISDLYRHDEDLKRRVRKLEAKESLKKKLLPVAVHCADCTRIAPENPIFCSYRYLHSGFGAGDFAEKCPYFRADTITEHTDDKPIDAETLNKTIKKDDPEEDMRCETCRFMAENRVGSIRLCSCACYDREVKDRAVLPQGRCSFWDSKESK